MPKVSVIIPTYNNAGYISDAIDSVLTQTYDDYEIIVIDDGSTDDTKKVLEKYNSKIRYFYQANKGISAARNRGMAEAKGEYIALLDSDDIWFPEKIAMQVETLERNKQIGLVGSLLKVVDRYGNSLGTTKPKKSPGNSFENGLIDGCPAPSSFVIRRECFDVIGLFDEGLEMFEDLDLYLRISKKYMIRNIDIPLGCYRIHSSNTTKDDFEVYRNQVAFAKKWLSCIAKESEFDRVRAYLLFMIKKYSRLLVKHNIQKWHFYNSLKYLTTYSYYQLLSLLWKREGLICQKLV